MRDKSQNNLQYFWEFSKLLQKWGIFALLEDLQPAQLRAICIMAINPILQLQKYFALKKGEHFMLLTLLCQIG